MTNRDLAVGVELDADSRAVTPASLNAARHALWIASRSQARIALVYSTWEERDDRADPPGEAAVRALEALALELRKGNVPVEVVFADERPWLALARRAARLRSDFVFVARREHSGRRLLGVNALKLLRVCPSPVWVVAPERSLPYRRVLAATDLSPVGAQVTRLGASLAEMSGAELHVVHAWQKTMEFQLEAGRISAAELGRRVVEHESTLRDGILTALGGEAGVSPLLHVGCTSPERAILEGIGAIDPDLVVMGTLSRTGVPGMLMGNTAERVIGQIGCSLLTVKPEGFVTPVKP